MFEYAARTGTLPAPPHVVWDDLAERRRTGTRAWLDLQDGERAPEVLEASRLHHRLGQLVSAELRRSYGG